MVKTIRNVCIFFNAIQKYGWDNFEHIILEEGLTEEEAVEKEKYYIALWHTNDDNYGYNLTAGGEISPKGWGEKVSKMLIGNKHTYGLVLSEERRQHISEERKEYARTHTFSNRGMNEEEEARRRENLKPVNRVVV